MCRFDIDEKCGRKMRNGGQGQQTAVMAPPHLNGSAQFVSGGYVGYAPRQSWGQHFQGPQHPRNTARPLSHPPPPPSRRADGQRPSGNGSANPKSAPLLYSSKPGTHRSTTPSVSWGQRLFIFDSKHRRNAFLSLIFSTTRIVIREKLRKLIRLTRLITSLRKRGRGELYLSYLGNVERFTFG